MTTLTIYNYYRDTKEFLGESQAVIDPMGDGHIIPACATTKEVPEFREGYTRIFNTEYNVWQERIDHRGQIVYNTTNGLQEQVDYIGEYKEEHVLDAPLPGQTWIDNKWGYTRAAIVNALISARDIAAVSYSYKGVIIKLGDGQRADLAALLLALTLEQLPEEFVLNWSENGFDDTENATVQVTLAELSEFCMGALKQRNTAFDVYAILLSNVHIFITPDEAIDAYNQQLQALL